MSIRIECEECGKKYSFGDNFAGRVVPCKACDADIEIPDAEDDFDDDDRDRGRRATRARGGRADRRRGQSGDRDRGQSRRRPRPAEDDFEDAKQGGSNKVVIGLGIGAAVVVVLVVLGVVFLAGKDDVDPADDQLAVADNNEQNPNAVANNPVKQNPVVPGQRPNPINPNPNPVNPNPVNPNPVNPNPVVPNAPNKPVGGFVKPAGGVDPLPAANEADAAKPMRLWKVAVDPAPPIEVTWKETATEKKNFGSKNPIDLVFAGAGSPYFAYREDSSSGQWSVFNITDRVQVGSAGVTGRVYGIRNTAISSDGNFFSLLKSDGLFVSDVRKKKSLGKLPTGAISFNSKVHFPNPTTLAFLTDKETKFWALPSGDPIRTIPMGTRPTMEAVAFSPGGKYFAVPNPKWGQTKASVKVHEISSGELAGDFEFPHDASACRALMFAPDGKTFLAHFSGAGTERVWSWDVATGESTGFFDLKGSVGGSSDWPTVQWFPDGKSYLFKRRHIVNRDAKGVLFSSPTDIVMTIVGDNHALRLTNEDGKYAIARTAAADIDLTKAAETVAKGGVAIDAELPTLTKPDISEKAEVVYKSTQPIWKLPIDKAAEVTSKWQSRVTLPKREMEFTGFHFSSANNNRMVVSYGLKTSMQGFKRPTTVRPPSRRPSGRKPGAGKPDEPVSLDVIDMVTGKSTATLNLNYDSNCLALSPSGKLAMMRVEQGQDRVDIYSVDDGQHVAGWRPFDDEARSRKVVSAVFVDDTHVVTSSDAKKMRMWELPACKCVYEVEAADVTVFSQSAKYFMLRDGFAMVAVDSLTGNVIGRVPTEKQLPTSAAIHPDGSRMLIVLFQGRAQGHKAFMFDLNNGRPMDEFPIPTSLGQSMHWCGNDCFLADNELLVDSTVKVALRKYKRLDWGQHASSSPDGRHWYATGVGDAISIVGASLPEPGLREKLSPELIKDMLVVGPGSKLSLDTSQMAGHPTNANFIGQVVEKIKANLVENEQTLAAGQPVYIKLTMSERSTGQTIEYTSRSFGIGAIGRRNEVTQVAEVVVDCVASVVVNGKTMWVSKSSPSGTTYSIRRKDGESIADNLRARRWASVEQFFLQLRPPKYVFKSGAGAVFGNGEFTVNGAVAAP